MAVNMFGWDDKVPDRPNPFAVVETSPGKGKFWIVRKQNNGKQTGATFTANEVDQILDAINEFKGRQ